MVEALDQSSKKGLSLQPVPQLLLCITQWQLMDL